jgi:hypothetical protein
MADLKELLKKKFSEEKDIIQYYRLLHEELGGLITELEDMLKDKERNIKDIWYRDFAERGVLLTKTLKDIETVILHISKKISIQEELKSMSQRLIEIEKLQQQVILLEKSEEIEKEMIAIDEHIRKSETDKDSLEMQDKHPHLKKERLHLNETILRLTSNIPNLIARKQLLHKQLEDINKKLMAHS